MIWQCDSCMGDIVLDKRPEETEGACPSCDAFFSIIIDDDGEVRRLVFDDEVTDSGENQSETTIDNIEDEPETVWDESSGTESQLELVGGDPKWQIRTSAGAEYGPAQLEELQSMAKKGIFGHGDLVKDPAGPWRPIDTSPEFKQFISAAPAKPFAAGKKPKKQVQQRSRRRRGRRFGLLIILLIVSTGAAAFYKYVMPQLDLENLSHIGSRPKKASKYETLINKFRSEINAVGANKQIDLITPPEAEALLNENRLESYQTAITRLKKSYLENPDETALAGLLAEALATLFKFDRSFENIDAALTLVSHVQRLQPTSAYGLRGRLAAMTYSENYEGVEPAIEKAVTEGADVLSDKRVRLYQAIADLNIADDKTSAVIALEKLSSDRPRLPEAMVWLARGYFDQGRLFEAATLLQNPQLEKSDDPTTHLIRGEIMFLEQRFKLAAMSFQSALRIQPNFVLPRIYLGIINYLYLKNTVKGEEYFNEVLTRYKAFTGASQKKVAQFHLCNLHFVSGQRAKAITSCEESFRVSPYFPPTLVRRAQIAETAEQYEVAVEALRRARRFDETNPSIVALLSDAYIRNGLVNNALQFLTEILPQFQRSPRVLLELTRAYVIQAQYDQADRILRTSLGQIWLMPESSFLPQLSEIEFDLSLNDTAQTLNTYRDKRPTSAAAWTASAVVEFLRGDIKRFDQYLAQAQKLEEDFYPAFLFEVQGLLKKNQREQAQARFDALPASIKTSEYGKVLGWRLAKGSLEGVESLQPVPGQNMKHFCWSLSPFFSATERLTGNDSWGHFVFECAKPRVALKSAIALARVSPQQQPVKEAP